MTSFEKVMTQEEIELLLIDLSARLSYGVICQVDDGAAGLNDGKLVEIDISKELVKFDADYYWDAYIDDIKPYLRPMSSMTEEEREELEHLSAEYFGKALDKQIQESLSSSNKDESRILEYIASSVIVDWMNRHHFDYRGLIENGLALEAPNDMYKK